LLVIPEGVRSGYILFKHLSEALLLSVLMVVSTSIKSYDYSAISVRAKKHLSLSLSASPSDPPVPLAPDNSFNLEEGDTEGLEISSSARYGYQSRNSTPQNKFEVGDYDEDDRFSAYGISNSNRDKSNSRNFNYRNNINSDSTNEYTPLTLKSKTNYDYQTSRTPNDDNNNSYADI
jgi:hypothetical protein